MVLNISSLLRRSALLGLGLAVTACASNPLSGLTERFRNNDVEEANVAEEDRRKPVLALDEVLTPDPELAAQPVSVPPAYTNAAWPQPGGEADHTMHHLSSPLALNRLWSVRTPAKNDKRAPVLAPPVVADSRIFLIDANAIVHAYDADTGRRIWSRELTPDVQEEKPFWAVFSSTDPAEIGFGGGVAYDGGRVFVSSGFGFVAALDAENGEQIWQSETDAPIRSAPTAANGAVYVVTNANTSHAFSQETGEEIWDFESFEETARFLSPTSPAATDEVVIAPFSSGEVTALAADTGRRLWAQTIGRSSRMTALSDLNDIAGSPVIDRDTVFAISHAEQMAAIDLRSGNLKWELAIAGLQTPWVAGDFVYVVSTENQLVAVGRETGKIAWVSQLPKFENEKKRKNRIQWTGPVLAGGQLVLTSSHGLIALVSPEDGALSRSVRFDRDGTMVRPVVANEKLYVLSQNGRLQSFN